MKLKKINKMAAMVFMTTTLLVSCGSETKDDENADAGDSGVTDVSGDEVVELKFTYWGDGLEKKALEDLVEKFNAEYPNIHVTPQQIPGDNYMEKMNTMASNKTLPDVGYMKENSVAQWGQNDMLIDQTSLFVAGGPFENKFEDNIFQYEENGPIYGSSISIGRVTLLYNKDFTDAQNIQIPYTVDTAYTWDEFVRVLQELTFDRNGKHPYEEGFDPENIETYGINNFTWLWEALAQSNGGGTVSPDGKQLIIATDETIDVLDKIQNLMYEDYVMPKPSQASNLPSGDIALLTNRVALTITGSWDLSSIGAAVGESGLNLGMGVLPTFQEQPLMLNFGPPVAVFNTDNVNAHPEEVQTFLEYVLAPENTIDVINSGLWQPNDKRWYTEPELIEKWTSNDFIPEHFEEAYIYPSLNNITQNKAFYCEDTESLETIISPALDQVWLNKKEPGDVVKEDILPKLEQQFGDKYEIVVD